jgi:hypothetical protein
MKKILKNLFKSFVLRKIHEYKMRKRYGSTYVAGYDDSYYEDEEYRKPKYMKRKKKKKDFKYMLKKMFD